MLAVFAAPASAAPKGADLLCPGATPTLIALSELPDINDYAKFAQATQKVVDAYKYCITVASGDGAIEPTVHYDETRAAQFEVLLGRTLANLGKFEEAHAAFAEARRLAKIVSDWTSPSMGYATDNKNGTTPIQNTQRSYSQFRESATAITKAADDELAKLAIPVPVATP
jgi:hypothetical protein